MAFDLATAKPVEESGGFDLSTAAPISDTPAKVAESSKEKGITDIIANRGGQAFRSLTRPFEDPFTTTIKALGGTAIATGGAINDLLGLGINKLAGIIPKDIKAPFVQSGADLINSIVNTDVGKYLAEKGKGLIEENPQVGTDIQALTDAAGLFAAPGIVKIGKAAAPAMGKAGATAKNLGAASKEKTMNLIKPLPTPEVALGQILQGKTKDLAKGKKAFSAVNTEGVSTYSDLDARLTDHVKTYARQVDSELMKDPNPHPLTDYTKNTKVGAETVSQNHVQDALVQMQELFTKIGDPAKATEYGQLFAKAQESGLTRKEVNDLARAYGNEFGDKAFSKATREPLTSVNAQAYENTRKGLKETARDGMGPEAKQLDDTLSSIINTRSLIQKNVEAVNKLKQKIDPRSLGEKIGRAVGVALDIATGGTVKGFVGKFLPRGVGNKVLNALDLEDNLSRNLEIINKALVSQGETPITAQPSVKSASYFGNKKGGKSYPKFGIPSAAPYDRKASEEAGAALTASRQPNYAPRPGVAPSPPGAAPYDREASQALADALTKSRQPAYRPSSGIVPPLPSAAPLTAEQIKKQKALDILIRSANERNKIRSW